MPVRRIPISRTSLTGRHAMGPGRDSVGFESSLERDLAELMHFASNVTHIEEQPVRIYYIDEEGRNHYYTPDFLIQRDNAPPLLIEVKLQKFLTPDLDTKLNAAKQYAENLGWVFEVWTEREIRTPRLKNIRFLLPYRQRQINPDRASSILYQLDTYGAMSIEDVLMACWKDETERAYGQAVLWHLLAVGKIIANLDKELTPQTTLHTIRRVS